MRYPVGWLLWLLFGGSPSRVQKNSYPARVFGVGAVEYAIPGSPTWPDDVEWESLRLDLTDSVLNGPFGENFYEENCEGLGSDAFAISKAGYGICMHAHACQFEFCRKSYAQDLPAYILDAQSERDIQTVLRFASQHNIQVTVKTTGHSYHGASTAANSILVWMANYPSAGNVTDSFQDCKGTMYHAAISVNGGETWNDVIEAVGPQYHAVTGGARTVSAVGGWLQGSGLSFTSRQYGLGVDQVIDFRVVLANGTIVEANACENEDLFWALRGGGGGTFGIVTHATYRLHEVVPITATSWFVEGAETVGLDVIEKDVRTWLTFWIDRSNGIDTRFGGFWNAGGVHLVFAGTREEANEAFLNEFESWYWNELLPVSGFIENQYGALPPSFVTTTYENWYEYKGGAEAYGNANLTDPTGDGAFGVEYIAARLMPAAKLATDPGGVLDLLVDLAFNLQLGFVNYFLGGNIQNVAANETSVHPALREAVWNVFGGGTDGRNKVIDFIPNTVTGACFNHHSPTEPDWKAALWGDNYDTLLGIKNEYDPNRVFHCWHCVGYTGEEPAPEDPANDDPYVPTGSDETPSSPSSPDVTTGPMDPTSDPTISTPVPGSPMDPTPAPDTSGAFEKERICLTRMWFITYIMKLLL